jgi:hypothetical protein
MLKRVSDKGSISIIYIIKFSNFVLSFRAIFCFINPDDPLPTLIQIGEGLLHMSNKQM